MLTAKLTQKGQATIPVEVRKQLDLHNGDRITFKIKGKQVIIQKIQPFDAEYHKALAGTLSEWDSQSDDEAYNDL